jgi:hypothetical protein
LVAVIADGPEESFTEWTAPGGQLPAGTREVLVARDQRMINRWEETGYSLDERGEGPVSILLNPPGRAALRIQLLEDPFGREGFSFRPYDAVLITTGSYVVSAVTPPVGSDFTGTVLAWLEASLSAWQVTSAAAIQR